VLLIYGAPVILSGQDTFLGYVRLDDTATWLAFIDQFFSHGRSLASLPSSTYQLLLQTNLSGSGYPSGAFMIVGVGHWITGIDSAWIFQPYMAACAAALAFCCWDLLEPIVPSAWLRAFVSFVAAQSALLFGYAAWGGIKELTAAYLLTLGIALTVRLLRDPAGGPRAAIPVGIGAAALIVTLGAGSAIYVGPALLVAMSVLVWRATALRPRIVAVLGWDLFAAANAGLAALAFSALPTAVLAFATPDHAREAGIALLAVDLVVLAALLRRRQPGLWLRSALGGAAVAVAVVVLVVAGTSVTPWVTLGGLLVLAALAVSSREWARGFFGGAGGPLVAVPVAGVLALPAWLTLSAYLNANIAFGNCDPITSTNSATCLGNLVGALRGIQVTGIWIDGDFRSVPSAPPSFANHLLIWVVIAGAVVALGWTLWRRRIDLALYVGIALLALAVLVEQKTGPWVMGKSLAISSPAVLLAGLTGGALLFACRPVWLVIPGVLVLGAIAGGVLWSNFLQYRDVTLAPRARLSELQTIGTKLAGHGPTFFNEYEIYGDRHFLRAGAPVEPAEYRVPYLPTLGNAYLDKPAWANIDSFGLATLAPYRSLVIRVGPTESLPPSIYTLIWSGRYYQLWQQPAHPALRVIQHEPLGDSLTDAYCGAASNAPFNPLCPIAPASVPPCTEVTSLAATAAHDDAELRAYQRTNPIVLRATQTQWPGFWADDHDSTGAPEDTLTPTGPGSAVAHIEIPHGVTDYQLWLGGSFARGFEVSVDGHHIGGVADQLDPPGVYEMVGKPLTLGPGVHTITVTYPTANLSPGNADSEEYTVLSEIALSPPLYPAKGAGKMLMVKPNDARTLCGRSLDWIEIVKPE
jgi:hypothetical protein